MNIIPIDKNGKQCGPVQSVSEKQWDKMVSAFGKNLRFKKTRKKTIQSGEVKLVPTTEAKSIDEKELRAEYRKLYGRYPLKSMSTEFITNKIKTKTK